MLKAERDCKAGVEARSDGLCERCGRQGHTFHHRKNRSAGGRWELANIVKLCGDGTQLCHGWVTTHPMLAMEEGFHIRSWDDPEGVPIRLHGRKLTRLTPDSPTYSYE